MKNNTLPTVTIAIPAYNEAEHIEKVLLGFLQQHYPNLCEILVADGGSSDGTPSIILELSKMYPEIKLLKNPKQIQSAGLNLMLEKAEGDIFLRADAHSEYANDYIERCVNALCHAEGIINTGGSQRYVAVTPFQAGIALGSKSILTGSAKYLNKDFSGYADTVYLGCFWRKKISSLTKEHGYVEVFDTSQVTNQDAELNLKILETFGQSIYVSSKIRVKYFPRKSLHKLVKQYFRFGRGRYLTFTKHPSTSPLRSQIPNIFFAIFMVLTMNSLFYLHWYKQTLWFYAVLLFVPLLETCRLSLTYWSELKTDIWNNPVEQCPNRLVVAFYCFLSILSIPTSFSLGQLYQMSRRQLLRQQGW